VSESLVVMKTELERRLGLGGAVRSLRDLVKKADADGALLLVDCSGSMGSVLATGERAIDALRQVVADVRLTVAVPAAAFGLRDGQTRYVDEIPDPCGGTPLHQAIEFGRLEQKSHLVVISDGMPDSPSEAMVQAKLFKGKIDAIYVGDDGGPGAAFMAELAKSTGGSGTVKDLTDQKQLTTHIKGLLGEGSTPAGGGVIHL